MLNTSANWLRRPASGAPLVMGILNVTPDSFSDGGLYNSIEAGLRHAMAMVKQGADIIDIGGESTRPGALPVSGNEEIDRVVGVIAAIRSESNIPISIDTSKPAVMVAAAQAGATMINDVRALREEGALQAAAATNLPVCLMHMRGEPRSMQDHPEYTDVLAEVTAFLEERIVACAAQGIQRDRILLDPGFGFGKSLQHNMQLLQNLDGLAATGLPVLAGVSRKSMIGGILGDAGRDRVLGSVILALYAWRKGAHIVRVHDVGQTVEALQIEMAVQAAK